MRFTPNPNEASSQISTSLNGVIKARNTVIVKVRASPWQVIATGIIGSNCNGSNLIHPSIIKMGSKGRYVSISRGSQSNWCIIGPRENAAGGAPVKDTSWVEVLAQTNWLPTAWGSALVYSHCCGNGCSRACKTRIGVTGRYGKGHHFQEPNWYLPAYLQCYPFRMMLCL